MSPPRLDILMITYNRPAYTAQTLERLLASCTPEMRVWVWHNGNHAETLEVVKSFQEHPQFHRLHHSPENKRLREPTNWFWENSDAEFVSKVDDDCLLPDGWGQTLMAAHDANPKLGVIGCWRFYDEDYVHELASQKTVDLAGGHRLMENCWVQGSGYVMRRKITQEFGGIGPKESFPGFCVRFAVRGWTNGWYFPFIHEEHMDDPRSEFCEIKTDEDFMAQRPLSAIRDDVTTVAEWAQRVKHMARSAQAASPDPHEHYGWRRRLRSVKGRLRKLVGAREAWRA